MFFKIKTETADIKSTPAVVIKPKKETWCEKCSACGVLMGGKVFEDKKEFEAYPDREPGYTTNGEWWCGAHRPKFDEEDDDWKSVGETCCECGEECDDGRHACIHDVCANLTCSVCVDRLKLKGDVCMSCVCKK